MSVKSGPGNDAQAVQQERIGVLFSRATRCRKNSYSNIYTLAQGVSSIPIVGIPVHPKQG